MKTTPFDRDLLLDLAAEYLQGTAKREDTENLEAILATNSAAREEFVSFCMLHGQLSMSQAAIGLGKQRPDSLQRRRFFGPRLPGLGRVAAVAAAVCLAAACLALIVIPSTGTVPRSNATRPKPLAGGSYDDRQLPLVTVASLQNAFFPSRPLTPATLRPVSETSLRSTSGADVQVAKETVFGMTAVDSGALYDGRVQARLAEPNASFSVTTSNLRIVDKGTAFTVDRIDDEHVAVTVLDGEVEVQSRVRLPVCYWPFDTAVADAAAISVADFVGGLSARLGSGATPVAGLIGAGALRFDNTPSAVATVHGGTGEQVGTGQLAMVEGITIEALIVSAWSGLFRDYDEIYRKEDGNCRVLFSFQNDELEFDDPEVPPGSCLSFGLHLAGRGYAELDMPLDGSDGRPTLAEITDGKPHHVVATYDSFTGRKAIFIDGTKRFEHVYPVGTLVLSGGPSRAEIGNSGGGEPFTGVVDELAVYDFALTPEEIAAHWRRAAAGESYFDSIPPGPGSPRWQAVTRLVEGQTMTFDQETGLPR
ncbi:MAG: LamG-like jellyroll fold domain-containing protein [Planctomycetia bacterium]